MEEVNGWLNRLEKVLVQTNQMPFLEDSFPFPWEEATQLVRERLALPDLTLSLSRASNNSSQSALEGMGAEAVVSSIELSPLEGSLFLIISYADLVFLDARMLSNNTPPLNFSNEGLQIGFYRFLLLKVIRSLSQLSILKTLSLSLGSDFSLPEAKGLSVDFLFTLPDKELTFRLFCPDLFIDSLKSAKIMGGHPLLHSPSTEDIAVFLSCRIGYSIIQESKVKKMGKGDCLLLDRCFYPPQKESGSAILFLGSIPILNALFSSKEIKVIDYILDDKADPLAPLGSKSEKSSLESASDETEEKRSLVITIGRLKLSIKQLVHLSPGVLLDSLLCFEEQVEVLLNEQVIARGELIELGEKIGCKITHVFDR